MTFSMAYFKSTSRNTNTLIMCYCLTALLEYLALCSMLKRRWVTVQMTCHSFFPLSFSHTALSAQQRCQGLMERHRTVHQDTWILLLAQQLADTDLEQVSNLCFLCFVHSGPGWSLPLLMLQVLCVTQPLCNTLRQAVNTQEE